ncbi:MAG TPA: DsrE family protein [Steroidobacteraceae bacterium]|jgi:uncharacterized protein involved in oxidation of intracellular sulfur|nr:DsrE family protein [Steroidobacteraceae bacterium]
MNVLFILNDAPNAAGRSLNALRLACALSIRSTVYVRMFLLGAAVACARRQPISRADPDDAAELVEAVVRRGGDVRVCSTCSEEGEARLGPFVQGCTLSPLDELSRCVCESDRVLVF